MHPQSCLSRMRSHPNTGFSLLEVLVAIVVASIVVMIITPPIFLATAARVQQRRVQQSMQLAQAEIDRVRSTIERGTYTDNDLPSTTGTDLSTIPAATTIAAQLKSNNPNCNTFTGDRLPSNSLLPIDLNGDCHSDFLVQSFRTPGPPGTAVPVIGFQMAVRVYADIPLLRSNLGQLSTVPVRLSLGGGLGRVALQPLTVLQSTLVRSDTSTALENYRTLCTNPGC